MWPSLRALVPLLFATHQALASVTPPTTFFPRGLASLGNTILVTANPIGYFVANITVNNQNFRVLIDTGSSDLWLVPPHDFGFDDTGIHVTQYYGAGATSVKGTIGFASVQLGGYTVDHQAFVNATSVGVTAVLEEGLAGLIGFSFDGTKPSPIIKTLKENGSFPDAGEPFLYNVFTQTPDVNNFIGISLSRTGDLEGSADASLTINEIDIAYGAVVNAPAVPLYPGDDGRWSVRVDDISVDGVNVTIPRATNANVPPGRMIALMDTGTPSTTFPDGLIDEIYSRIPGAEKRPITRSGFLKDWVIPCNTTSIVTIYIGDQPFPIHPLDLSEVRQSPDDNSSTICVNPFEVQYGWEYGAFFGDIVLRNICFVYNFGDAASRSPTGNSSMQLLSQTNPMAAAADVLEARMSRLTTAAATAALAADVSDAGLDESNNPSIKKYGTIIIALVGANLLVVFCLAVVGLILCVKGGGKSGGANYRRVMQSADSDGRSLDSSGDKRYSDGG